MERTWREKIEGTTDQILAQIKRLLDEGNIRRVVVKQQGKVIAEFPLTVGVVGTVLAPVAAAIGALTAVIADCSIEVEKTTSPAAATPEAGVAEGAAPPDDVRPAVVARIGVTGRGSRGSRWSRDADRADLWIRGVLAGCGENLVHWGDLKLPVGPTRFT